MNIWVDANGWFIPLPLLLGCLLAEILYFRGWWLLANGAQAKRAARAMTFPVSGSDRSAYRWNDWFWRGTFFLGAILVFLLAASAPIDALSSRLFWVHMVQHLLLLVVVAPLLVAAAPLLPLWLGLPRRARRAIKASIHVNVRRGFFQMGHWLLRRPVVACMLLVVGIWMWHWPVLYDLALTNSLIHDWCEHVTFLVVSLLFWAQVIPSPPFHPALDYPGRIVCIGIAIAQNLVLAALIGFAPAPIYAPYAHLITGPGGLTALQDQQFGAGLMWTFGDLPFGIALSILVHHWLLSQSDETAIALDLPHNP